jgi:hypothetical protein
VFSQLQVTLVCEQCKEDGLAAQCKHMLHLVPQWQSSARHERLKEVMADRPDLIQSELAVRHSKYLLSSVLLTSCLQGLAFDALQQCFRTTDIDALLSMKPPALEWKQPVYIIIDPAAGGPRSDFALISIVRSKGMATVSAPLAQWLERWSYEPEVLGSIPRWGILLGLYIADFYVSLKLLQLNLFIHKEFWDDFIFQG